MQDLTAMIRVTFVTVAQFFWHFLIEVSKCECSYLVKMITFQAFRLFQPFFPDFLVVLDGTYAEFACLVYIFLQFYLLICIVLFAFVKILCILKNIQCWKCSEYQISKLNQLLEIRMSMISLLMIMIKTKLIIINRQYNKICRRIFPYKFY